MSGGFPIGFDFINGQGYGFIANGAGVVDGTPTALTQPTSNNSLGAYTSITATSGTGNTTADATWMYVYMNNQLTASAAQRCAVDIAVGATGSEKVVASSLYYWGSGLTGSGSPAGSQGFMCYSFPVSIPTNTKISARYQTDKQGDQQNANTDPMNVGIVLFDSAMSATESYAGIDVIGYNSGNTVGTLLTVSANNTKGSFTQLTASSSRDYAGIYFTTPFNTSASTTPGCLFDIAIGGSGSEKVIISNISITPGIIGFTPITATPIYGPFFVPIPKSTAISMRYQTQDTTFAGQAEVLMYGIYQ